MTDKDEPQDFAPGIKQSGNAKISFKDEEYFKKVCLCLFVVYIV